MINAKITDIPVPVTRTEHFMYSAITGNESGLKADTQAEMYLDAIKNGDTSDLEELEPRTVLDMYLEARQTGVVDDLPKPRTTSEMLLYQAITGEDLGAKPVSNMDKYLSLLEPNNYDARLEIESEENVIHLTDSKNGRIEVKELEGNTLVNCCTDGAKELTLNGDIDVEGTSVTLTEGVDNGLVDVTCEGNTLVNLISLNNFRSSGVVQESTHNYKMSGISGSPNFIAKFNKKPNNGTTLTYFAEFSIPASATQATLKVRDVNNNYTYSLEEIRITNQSSLSLKGLVNIKHNSFSDESGLQLIFNYDDKNLNKDIGFTVSNFALLEGDWTNKEVPVEYFEGMKSVGECEGNKIEIVSQNKNLFIDDVINETGAGAVGNGSLYPSMFVSSNTRCRTKNLIKVKPNTTYYFSSNNKYHFAIVEFDKDNKQVLDNGWTIEPQGGIYTTSNNCVSIIVVVKKTDSSKITPQEIYGNIQIEEGSVVTSYVPHSLNKKEITLSEPLRALPNGIKDKVVKIGGKWYVERNCGQVVLDGSDDEQWESIIAFSKTWVFRKPLLVAKNPIKDYETVVNNMLVDKLPIVKYSTYNVENAQTISFSSMINTSVYNGTALYINKNSSNDLTGFKQWLSQNPITLIYELQTPVYEEITDPTVNTYNDITHISNNSTIPCNMKIKNTGYNVIVKPSTKYTIVTNTNKSTITTPSDVSEYSLVLSGKGTKVKNVMLFEGDYTNKTIPNYFEGVKSVGECEDNKIEIESKTENLFDMKKTVPGYIISNTGNISPPDAENRTSEFISVIPGEIYTYVATVNVTKASLPTWDSVGFYGKNKNFLSRNTYIGENSVGIKTTNNTFEIPTNCYYIRVGSRYLEDEHAKVSLGRGTFSEHIVERSAKKELSLQEPLRGLPNGVRDKIVVKSGKLMVERNCGEIVLDGSEDWIIHGYSTSGTIADRVIFKTDSKLSGMYIVNNLNTRMKTTVKLSGISDDFGTSVLRVGDSGRKYGVFMSIRLSEHNVRTIGELVAWLRETPINVVYELETPIYEEITPELQKLILRCYDNATLYFNTNIPPKSLISYTANTSNIYRYLDTLKLSKAERDSIINSMERV